MAAPVLDYVGVLDTSNANSGIAEFKITFSAGIRALMFEYKYQPVDQLIVDPDSEFESGFIYPDAVEPAQNETGPNSAYILPLPVPANDVNYNVAVRIYTISGVLSSGTSYTEWSNNLQLQRPPIQPEILRAFYDVGDYYLNNTIIYVDLSANSVDLTDFTVKFIASYYYVKRGETTTSWETTALLPLDQDACGNQIPRLTITAKGDVSLQTPQLYIAVNKVLPFVNLAVTYYSLSEISNTVTATQAEISAPVIDSVTYFENAVADQSMVVVWSAPSSAFIPSFAVDYYTLEVNVHGIDVSLNPLDWTPIGGQIPPSGTESETYTYNIDVSNNPQGYRFDFRVEARLTTGTETEWSNVDGADQVDILPPALSPLTYLVYNEDPANRLQRMVLDWTPASNSMQPLPAGFTASSYEIYLSVDEANPTKIADVSGNLLTYNYDVDPSYLTAITNLDFYVKAVITQTGGATSITTGQSDAQALNTYTYASAPHNLTIDWVINDAQVEGFVDVAFTWENVLVPGLGFQQDPSACEYYWRIFDASLNTTVVSGVVPYNPLEPGDKYDILTNYEPAPGVTTYRIEVYLKTPDTNEERLLNGESAISNELFPAIVPIIYDIVVDVATSKVSFKVLSPVLVAPQAIFVTSTTGVPETATPFSMANVPYVVDELGNYNYTITLIASPVQLPPGTLGFGIFVSNSAGIGYRTVVLG